MLSQDAIINRDERLAALTNKDDHKCNYREMLLTPETMKLLEAHKVRYLKIKIVKMCLI